MSKVDVRLIAKKPKKKFCKKCNRLTVSCWNY